MEAYQGLCLDKVVALDRALNPDVGVEDIGDDLGKGVEDSEAVAENDDRVHLAAIVGGGYCYIHLGREVRIRWKTDAWATATAKERF